MMTVGGHKETIHSRSEGGDPRSGGVLDPAELAQGGTATAVTGRSRGKGASLFLYDSSGTLERGTQRP